MCGIVAVTGYKKALPLLINGLEKLEYRGYDLSLIHISEPTRQAESYPLYSSFSKPFINNGKAFL